MTATKYGNVEITSGESDGVRVSVCDRPSPASSPNFIECEVIISMKYYQGHPDLPPTNKNRGEDVTSRLVKTYKPITIKDTPRCDENFTEAKEHGIEIKEVGDIPD